MKPLILILQKNDLTGGRLTAALDAQAGLVDIRRFPDGESYIRLETDVRSRDVIVVCSLDQPDGKFLPLIFLAETARDLGARSVGLVCPYLAYMRQDTRFKPGEGVTSAYFANALGRHFDWLVTVDPHLHRRQSLAEIYRIPTAIGHAAPLMAEWIRNHVSEPVIVGPDIESEQWVASVAQGATAPYMVLAKQRKGDRNVEVSAPEMSRFRGRTPVLVDDIISTARTMIETAKRLRSAGASELVAVGVHGLFVERAYEELRAAGVGMIATCSTVPHPSSAIDVTPALAEAAGKLIEARG